MPDPVPSLVRVGAVLGTVALAACTVNVNTEGATASETHRYTVGASPTLSLDTFDGAIEVHAWDRGEIEVVVEKQAGDDAQLEQITVEQSQQGDAVTLRVRGPERRGSSGVVIGVHYSPSARLRVAVPRTTALDVRSGDGSITVEDISGTTSLRSDDGSIVATRVTTDLRARTDDGSIRVREAGGKVDVETGDGSVTVNGALTHLRAKTGDGSVRVALEPGSRLEDDWLIETRDGTVEVRLPENIDADVDAVTSDGRVQSNYPGLRVERSDDEEARRELRATLGGGGRTLRIRTGDGSIRFER
jgi:hypothetical protein